MRGGLHKVCYDGAGDDAGESGQKGAGEGVSGFLDFGGYVAVSYTHLDVYKRQLRVSFKILDLRRLSLGSADPSEYSRS